MAHKGHIPWNKGKKGVQVNWTKGKKRPPFSDEWKKNMGLAQLGKKRSLESIQRMRIASIGRNKGRILTEEHKRKISLAMKGDKSPSWKGGITYWQKLLRKSVEYRLWRTVVFERDGYVCIWCGALENLHADHIKSFVSFSEIRFALDNGRTLCFDCHKSTETYGRNIK